MVKGRPELLSAAPETVAAASTFLLTQFFGDTIAVRKAVVSKPNLLRASTALQATLQWATGTLGASPAAALGVLPHVVGQDIDSTLEQWRQWFLQAGLTAAQVLSLAQSAPSLLTWDMKGQLVQLKLRYWRTQLSYSLSDLTRVPIFLMCSMARSASRHSALRHLHDFTPSHTRFLRALIAGGGATPSDFGPVFYASYVKQHSVGNHSVQEVLLPLSTCRGQPALGTEWDAELLSHPCVPAVDTSARKHAPLYAALHAIQQRDWALSDAGRGWLAPEAAAKAADLTARAAKRTAARSVRQQRKRSSSKNSGGVAEEGAM